MDLVDLTQPITAGMQVYPGDPEVGVADAADLASGGFRVSALHLGSHTGTHVDAPSHADPAGSTLDELALGRFCGPARLVWVQGEQDAAVRLGQVAGQLADLGDAQIVLFATGWSRYFGTDRYLHHPYLDRAIAEHLLAAGITAIGIDTLSVDRTSPADPAAEQFAVHHLILGAGGLIFENLTNLHAATFDRAWFAGFPLRIAGGDGSPVRAVMFGSRSHPAGGTKERA